MLAAVDLHQMILVVDAVAVEGAALAIDVPGMGLHLNKGVAGRFREALSGDDQELCMQRLGPVLREMGYVS